MKKLTKLLSLALCAATVCFGLIISGCTGYEYYHQNYFTLIKLNSSNIYAAAAYSWNGEEDNLNIVIPDACNGHPLTQIGSVSTNNPFQISFPSSYGGGTLQYICEDGTAEQKETVIFTVYIGKNIISLDSFIHDEYCYKNTDGTEFYVGVKIYYVVSEENKYFYSQDGVLYNEDGSVAEWRYM